MFRLLLRRASRNTLHRLSPASPLLRPCLPITPTLYRVAPRFNHSSAPPPSTDIFIQTLENTARAPWLRVKPQSEKESLQRVYLLIYQIFLYLARPQDVKDFSPEQYLMDFMKAEVPKESEIQRARDAVMSILRSVDISVKAFPQNSPLRAEHRQIFDLFDALTPILDQYLAPAGGFDTQEWNQLWERSSPILVTTAMLLDEKGFGFTEEESSEELSESTQ